MKSSESVWTMENGCVHHISLEIKVKVCKAVVVNKINDSLEASPTLTSFINVWCQNSRRRRIHRLGVLTVARKKTHGRDSNSNSNTNQEVLCGLTPGSKFSSTTRRQMHQIRRGASRVWRSNTQVHLLEDALANAGASIQSVEYVKSAENVADFWQRRTVIPRHVQRHIPFFIFFFSCEHHQIYV